MSNMQTEWGEEDSNLRRLSRRVYSALPLTARASPRRASESRTSAPGIGGAGSSRKGATELPSALRRDVVSARDGDHGDVAAAVRRGGCGRRGGGRDAPPA